MLYTIFRVILIPFSYYWHIRYTYYMWDIVPTYMLICAIITDLMWLVIAVLNYYWYFLILKSMAVMLGIIKKSKKKKP